MGGVLALFVAMCQANKFLIKTGSNGEDTDYEEKAEKKKIQIHAPVGRLTKDQKIPKMSLEGVGIVKPIARTLQGVSEFPSPWCTAGCSGAAGDSAMEKVAVNHAVQYQ